MLQSAGDYGGHYLLVAPAIKLFRKPNHTPLKLGDVRILRLDRRGLAPLTLALSLQTGQRSSHVERLLQALCLLGGDCPLQVGQCHPNILRKDNCLAFHELLLKMLNASNALFSLLRKLLG
jgi:hypothetical protein